MGKLLGHQIKSHFKNNWFIPVLPLVLIVFGLLFSSINYYNLAMHSVTIGITALFCGYIVAAVTVIVGDYNMFFGDSALFYESIPISPLAKTFSRFIYYFVMFTIYSLYLGAIFVILTLASTGISTIPWKEISSVINEIGAKNLLISIGIAIIFLFNCIARIVFSISLGGGKKLRRFGFGGSVLAFIILGVLEGFAIKLLDTFDLFTKMELVMNNGDVFVNFRGVGSLMLLVVETILFLLGVYYFHKNRISVS
ncbi:hypothetical protein HKO22_06520 [Peptoniphilus sp. AGMB00490]|uniref:ABC-2 family transporter protein n=1 Tax=Peptoniphilus faecalis TaxID=2731255 RepID=A0A848R7W1_9FIRM|nr:hypothetical protein [Peptoniphilus faecalis]NMW85387.1 hypothetical protein [Peptoniphilus faecalis]